MHIDVRLSADCTFLDIPILKLPSDHPSPPHTPQTPPPETIQDTPNPPWTPKIVRKPPERKW